MKEAHLRDSSVEYLQAIYYFIKIITIALIVAIVVLFSITIYGMIVKDNIGTFTALFVIGLSCSGILPIQFISMKRIKTELKSRKIK